MKIKVHSLKRILAVLLILTTICSVFASCAGDIGLESDSNGSDSVYATDASGNAIGTDGSDDVESANGLIQLFANGEYTARVIRSDTASATDKEAYTKIRELLKKYTGKDPGLSTDFTAAGTEKYDGPAILVGETNYKESQNAYKKLNNGQATATVSGNKYVIAVSSLDAFEKLLTQFKSNLNKKATKDAITIDSSWKIDMKLDAVTDRKSVV